MHEVEGRPGFRDVQPSKKELTEIYERARMGDKAALEQVRQHYIAFVKPPTWQIDPNKALALWADRLKKMPDDPPATNQPAAEPPATGQG